MGDLVLLCTAGLPLRKNLSRDLSLKYTGPFTVPENSASGLSSKFDFPTELGRTHPTFHVSQPVSFKKTTQNQKALETHILFDLQMERRPVENVFAKRTRNGVKEALVHYVYSDLTEDHWTATSSI